MGSGKEGARAQIRAVESNRAGNRLGTEGMFWKGWWESVEKGENHVRAE